MLNLCSNISTKESKWLIDWHDTPRMCWYCCLVFYIYSLALTLPSLSSGGSASSFKSAPCTSVSSPNWIQWLVVAQTCSIAIFISQIEWHIRSISQLSNSCAISVSFQLKVSLIPSFQCFSFGIFKAENSTHANASKGDTANSICKNDSPIDAKARDDLLHRRSFSTQYILELFPRTRSTNVLWSSVMTT